MVPDPKHIAAMIVAKAKPAGGDDDADGMQMAAGDFLDAVHSKDPAALADAFKSMWQLLESTEPDEKE